MVGGEVALADVQILNPRNVNKVIGCELSRQLNEPSPEEPCACSIASFWRLVASLVSPSSCQKPGGVKSSSKCRDSPVVGD